MHKVLTGRSLIVVSALLAILGVAACGSSEDDSSSGSSINVVLAAPFTGETAYYGEWMNDAWTLAMDKYGSSVDGDPINLIKADTKCTPTDAAAAGRRALEQDPVAMVTVCSGDTHALIPIAGRAEVPIISDSFDPNLTAEGNAFLWRVQTHDGITNDLFGAYIAQQGVDSIGIIHDTTPYGEANASTLTESLSSAGVTIATDVSYDFSATDYSGQILAVKKANVDAAYIEGYDLQAARLVKQASQLGLDVPLYLPTTASSATFQKAAGSARSNVTFATSFLPDWSDAAKEYTEAWTSGFDYVPNADTASFYEIAVGIITALKETGGTTSSVEFNDAFGKLSVSDMPMGTLAFDASGDIADPLVIVGRWKGEDTELVEVLSGQQ